MNKKKLITDSDCEKIRELACQMAEIFEKENVSYQIWNAALNLCVTGIIMMSKNKNLWDASDFLDRNKIANMLHLKEEGWTYGKQKKKSRAKPL